MRATIIRDGKRTHVEIPQGATVAMAMARAGSPATTSLAMRNGVLAHPSEELGAGDELEIIGMVYGG